MKYRALLEVEITTTGQGDHNLLSTLSYSVRQRIEQALQGELQDYQLKAALQVVRFSRLLTQQQIGTRDSEERGGVE